MRVSQGRETNVFVVHRFLNTIHLNISIVTVMINSEDVAKI